MTLATFMPYLLVAGGYLLRHFNILGNVLSIFAGPNQALPASPSSATTVTLGNRPLLDAVNASVKQIVNDALSGHVTSVKSEIEAAVKSALAAAVADLKAKS